jgi:hypothetical protein
MLETRNSKVLGAVIRLGKREVPLSKQLQKKGDLIEWVLQLKEAIGWQAKTRMI